MYQSQLKTSKVKCLHGETSLEEFARHRNVPADQVKFQLAEAQNNIQRSVLLYKYLLWVQDMAPVRGWMIVATEQQWTRVLEKLPVLNITGMGLPPQIWVIGYKAKLWKEYQKQHDVQMIYTLDQLYGLLPVALQALKWASSTYAKKTT